MTRSQNRMELEDDRYFGVKYRVDNEIPISKEIRHSQSNKDDEEEEDGRIDVDDAPSLLVACLDRAGEREEERFDLFLVDEAGEEEDEEEEEDGGEGDDENEDGEDSGLIEPGGRGSTLGTYSIR